MSKIYYEDDEYLILFEQVEHVEKRTGIPGGMLSTPENKSRMFLDITLKSKEYMPGREYRDTARIFNREDDDSRVKGFLAQYRAYLEANGRGAGCESCPETNGSILKRAPCRKRGFAKILMKKVAEDIDKVDTQT